MSPGEVPITHTPRKNKTMAGDIIPDRLADRYLWWKNLRDKIETEGPKIGLVAAEISDIKDAAAEIIDLMEAVTAAETALKGARAKANARAAAIEPTVRMSIRNWKTRPLYPSSGLAGTLQLVGSPTSFDPNTFKPRIKVSIVGRKIKIDFSKRRCDSVVVYRRLQGAPDWTKLGIDSLAPYFDTQPLATPNVPETREYYVIGLIDDIEVGQPSEIVSIVFGG